MSLQKIENEALHLSKEPLNNSVFVITAKAGIQKNQQHRFLLSQEWSVIQRFPKGERASLIRKLVLSFDAPSPEKLREDWLSEAQSRAKEIDDGLVKLVSGSKVIKKDRALTK